MLKQSTMFHSSEFQLTAARRRLVLTQNTANECEDVSTHSRPKAAGGTLFLNRASSTVSTHSRPKASGVNGCSCECGERRFNSQPPEGGWASYIFSLNFVPLFQLTAARRRLVIKRGGFMSQFEVSTHSRPKAAGGKSRSLTLNSDVSTHSRPKAAGAIFKMPVGL